MKVLVVKLSSMGDIISTLPALTDAKVAVKELSFDWVVEENFVEIPSWHQTVNSIIPIALRRLRKKPLALATLREMQRFWQKLRLEQYDYILDVQGLIKSAVVSRIARGISCGFNAKSARESIASYLYQNEFAIAKNLHAVERSRQLFAKALGYELPENFPDYGLMKDKFLLKNRSDEPYLVFVHGTSRKNKCWQATKWLELAHLAKDAGFKVQLPWGNEEELTRANNLASAANNVIVLPQLSLTEIGKILLGAKAIVALDTGLGHLAAALGVPALSLYGPTDPQLAGTYGKNQLHLTHIENLDAATVWQKMRQPFGL